MNKKKLFTSQSLKKTQPKTWKTRPQMNLKPFRPKSGRGSGLEDPAAAAFSTGLIVLLVPAEDKIYKKLYYTILVIFFLISWISIYVLYKKITI